MEYSFWFCFYSDVSEYFFNQRVVDKWEKLSDSVKQTDTQSRTEYMLPKVRARWGDSFMILEDSFSVKLWRQE